MCLSAIYWARIAALYFACNSGDAANAGFDDLQISNQLSLDWQKRSITVEQDCRDEGLVVFEKWISNPNKEQY